MIIAIVQPQHNETDDWGSDQEEALSELARKYSKAGDKVGLYLCAIVEEEVKRVRGLGSAGCMTGAVFYLSMALAHMSDNADHELCHILLPTVQEMFAKARRKALAIQNEPAV